MNVALAFNVKPIPESFSAPATAGTGVFPLSTHGTASKESPSPDVFAEWDEIETVRAVRTAIEEDGHTVIEIEANNVLPHALLVEKPDIVFNIAEGFGARSREAQVPAVCEMFGIPHSGSDAVTLGVCLDKAHTKEILSYYGISTPPFFLVHDAAEIPSHPLSYPQFVKPVHEGSSKGIFSSSICNTPEDVRREVERIRTDYNQPALIEEYLPGREFTIAMLGNGDAVQILPIVEFNFAAFPVHAPRIDSFESKWIYDQPGNPLDSLHCPAMIPDDLRLMIETICTRAYRVLRILDWARIDVRLDANGVPHIIEINPLPGIIPDPAANSCFPRAAREAGYSYNQLIQRVLRLACERYGLHDLPARHG